MAPQTTVPEVLRKTASLPSSSPPLLPSSFSLQSVDLDLHLSLFLSFLFYHSHFSLFLFFIQFFFDLPFLFKYRACSCPLLSCLFVSRSLPKSILPVRHLSWSPRCYCYCHCCYGPGDCYVTDMMAFSQDTGVLV